MINGDVKARCDPFVHINRDLRIPSWCWETFPFRMNGGAKDFETGRVIDIGNATINFALKFLEENKVIRSIRETIEKGRCSNVRFLDVLEEE